MLLKSSEKIDCRKQSHHDFIDVYFLFSLLCAFTLEARQNLLLFGYDRDIKDLRKSRRAKGIRLNRNRFLIFLLNV